MKTFNDLKIGDTIYRLEKTKHRYVPIFYIVPEKNSYGNLYDANILHKETIRDINGTLKEIEFNKSESYDNRPFFTIKKKLLFLTKITVDRYVYFSDELAYKNGFYDFLIDMINESEQSVKDKKIESDKFIASIREYYYDILNPSSVKSNS